MNALRHDPALVLADRWQRGFPLVARPFAELGRRHDLTEAETLAAFRRLKARGLIDRIGAVVRPHSAGASTLAAMAVPAHELEAVAAMVSAEACVNHNYERDHPINLWFVVTAADEKALTAALARIGALAGREVLDLRLVEPYHIDLGFGLASGRKVRGGGRARRKASATETELLAALQDGLALVARPYGRLAERLGWSEAEATAALAALIDDGIVSRFGCVLRHRALGFTANAMAVWDVEDAMADGIGRQMAELPGVSLCYRRRRALPRWPYNLFAMVHGGDEAEVRAGVAAIAAACDLGKRPHDILFSRRCFLQRGARFGGATTRRAA